MKNNTLVGYITDKFDVIVDRFDIDHDCVGYDCKNHAYIIGSVLNVQGQSSGKIIKAFKAGVKDMNDYQEVSIPEIIMTGKHLLGYSYTKGYVYDKAPINIKSLLYAEASDDYGCLRITLNYDDGSKAEYDYGIDVIENNDDIRLLKESGVDVRVIRS